jgi:putative endonuclease
MGVGCWLYILRCADRSYYTGTTRGTLEKRIAEHQAGTFGGYTAERRPIALVYSERFERIMDAIAMEKRLKGWSRAKKEALISGNLEQLRQLSRRRG